MGIGRAATELLIKLRTAGYLGPQSAVIEVGAQQLAGSFFSEPERITLLGEVFGVDRPSPFVRPSSELSDNPDWDILTAPFARELWHWLGFEYAAVDIDGSPDSIPLDLNYDSVPVAARNKYNLVTNFGTTEHVPNQLNAFKIIHELTAPNGIMVHEVPAQGMFNHGMINYNFKFFWLLMRSNGYKFIHADFTAAEAYAGFPDNVVEYLNASTLGPSQRLPDYKAVDAGWLLVMQKPFDIDFVPPIDVNTGTPTDIESLRERYWTVFEPDRFDEWQASVAKAGPAREESIPSLDNSPPALGVPAKPSSPPPSLQGATDSGSWRLGAVIKPWRIIRRLVRNSDVTAQATGQVLPRVVEGISNQSDLLNRKIDAIVEGIGNQSDLIRRKLDALNRVMHELREIQKAQLAMQRQAADMIRQLTNTAGNSQQTDKRVER
jgi:hypothetical protein